MHYIDEGEGRPFLLLHGNPTWSYLWRNVIPHLEALGWVIAVDLIGMGRSDKPAIGYRYDDHYAYLEGFIEALRLEGVTLVLHDWGSVLGFRYAMEHDARIRAIAFMEANVRPRYSWEEFEGPAGELFRQFRTPGIGWDLLIEQNMMIERVLPGAVLRPLTEIEMDYYREPYSRPTAIPGPAPKQLAVTGGTGSFGNAGGDGTLVEFGNGKGKLTLHLLSLVARGGGG
jgi:haloalkane dehalogenase